MTQKEPFITKIIIIQGLCLGLFAFIINLGFIYYDDTISFKCLNGTTETYYKANLSQEKNICGNPNIYIFNDNSGFGVYLPNQITKDYIKSIDNRLKTNLSYN